MRSFFQKVLRVHRKVLALPPVKFCLVAIPTLYLGALVGLILFRGLQLLWSLVSTGLR